MKRYNLRDQLLLTGGSDSKVVLLNVASLASTDPTTEDEEEEEAEKEIDHNKVSDVMLCEVALKR